jgi:3-hydroxyisobutyrate dehydrogenase-like beta-hydroxyacid dehydrogenase
MTIFVVDFPFDTVVRIWDIFFIEGRKVIYRIALAVFKIMEDKLINGDMQDMFECIKSYKSQGVETEALLKVANNFTFSKELMRKYETEFEDPDF